MRILALLLVSLCAAVPLAARTADSTPRVVVISVDGVRWREIFRGADPALTADKKYVHPDIRADVIDPPFVQPADRGAALTPFLHTVEAQGGVLLGDRDAGSCISVANDLWYSYPGYNEFLTGAPDPDLTTNEKEPNRNATVFEYLQRRADFAGAVAAVGTWDVFPFIFNAPRSHVPVNEGLADRFPTDVRTARAAFELLRAHRYRALYIGFGDTDEFAHAGDYAGYLLSIERGDAFIGEVWNFLQSDPYYRGRTTLFVITDHGRGVTPTDSWREHGSPRSYQLDPDEDPAYRQTGAIGSDQVWLAALGPAVNAKAKVAYDLAHCAHSAQLAASVATALGVDWHGLSPRPGVSAAPPFAFVTTERR
jgi:hypothetical protein